MLVSSRLWRVTSFVSEHPVVSVQYSVYLVKQATASGSAAFVDTSVIRPASGEVWCELGCCLLEHGEAIACAAVCTPWVLVWRGMSCRAECIRVQPVACVVLPTEASELCCYNCFSSHLPATTCLLT